MAQQMEIPERCEAERGVYDIEAYTDALATRDITRGGRRLIINQREEAIHTVALPVGRVCGSRQRR